MRSHFTILFASFALKIVILSLPPESSPGTATCLALEFLVDASIFYRTMGGLGIAVFRQERMLQKIYILNSVLHNLNKVTKCLVQ